MNSAIDASFDVLTGQAEHHLVECWNGQKVHFQAIEAFNKLKVSALNAGFELDVASGFRSFERQQLIWQDKVTGKRPVLDKNERPLDVHSLSSEELLWSLLHWSALPGTSRHHWGTDLDVYDAKALRDSDQKLCLTVSECVDGGVLSPFHCWLDERIAAGQSFGFSKPYASYQGGVAAEPWHLSYQPVASHFQQKFDFKVFNRLLNEAQWPLRAEIEKHAELIYKRYVCVAGMR